MDLGCVHVRFTKDAQEEGRLDMIRSIKHRTAEIHNALRWLNRNNPSGCLDALNREYTNILDPVERERMIGIRVGAVRVSMLAVIVSRRVIGLYLMFLRRISILRRGRGGAI